jgi:hypothetical protein
MARFLLIEQAGGYASLSDKQIEELVDSAKKDDGIANYSFENTPEAQATLKNLSAFYDVFKDDPILDDYGIRELSVEYFIISVYLLVRHARMNYVMDDTMKTTIHEFVKYFHQRWKTFDETEDHDILTFSNNRQQTEGNLETRDRILRQIFFEYLASKNISLVEKDKNRAFNELQRITIYRKGKGMCQQCLREEKPELEARVGWSEYQADHIYPHSLGGKTEIENGELLCRYHNQSKGAKVLSS